jgi:hypothetical protein
VEVPEGEIVMLEREAEAEREAHEARLAARAATEATSRFPVLS